MVNVEKVPYKSIEVETDAGTTQTISEGFKIKFVTEDNGELKKGTVIGLKGSKSEKVEIEMIPEGSKHRETWRIVDMVEGSLKLIVDGDGEEE